MYVYSHFYFSQVSQLIGEYVYNCSSASLQGCSEIVAPDFKLIGCLWVSVIVLTPDTFICKVS